ncbi:MAG: EamA family transporter RarD [Bacteroidetes bacterium]|nr:EamA family transporter RarD [Bacteroidota bacterium]MCL2303525.1 EamA family transporter RarD [Lentimicrobiaceae bacterium]
MPKSKGILYAIGAYLIWGTMPIYWYLLSGISPYEIVAHRILWSAVLMFILSVLIFKIDFRPILRSKKKLLCLLCTSALITINWTLYIWAVENGHVVDASLGYYINPFINIILGVLFLKERLSGIQKIAIAFAFFGVAYLTFSYGKLPFVTIVLACTFSLYGFMRKKAQVESMPALTVETVIALPVALGFLAMTFINHTNTYQLTDVSAMILIMLTGPITAIPLFLFGKATETVSMTTLGFVQYLSPTLQLLVGVLLFKEVFTTAHIICFSSIWAGLVFYSVYLIKGNRT